MYNMYNVASIEDFCDFKLIDAAFLPLKHANVFKRKPSDCSD
jgi:hypothetical protein